jgi:hypothetical protein
VSTTATMESLFLVTVILAPFSMAVFRRVLCAHVPSLVVRNMRFSLRWVGPSRPTGARMHQSASIHQPPYHCLPPESFGSSPFHSSVLCTGVLEPVVGCMLCHAPVPFYGV